MHDAFDFMMTEHAAWRQANGCVQRVFVTPDGGRWLATLQDGKLMLDHLSGAEAEPVRDVFTLSKGLNTVPDLTAALRGLGSVVRFRNADLWDAIGTSIIRQVIRAGQSKKLYRAFCQAHGEQVGLPNGTTYALFPAPEIVLGLSDDQFSSLGMAFKRRPLKAAAEAYLEHGAKWRELAPDALITELQIVPRIGPWTAHAAVADWSNDWSLYPYADLAVRTWAKRAAPSYDWPADEPAFGQAWRALAGEHLCSLTLLTLAWGSQHGDIG
jgi:DNA-3-methyladenine glycosylase II